MSGFAVYLHPQTCLTSKPVDQIEFMGHSLPHFNSVRAELERQVNDYPVIPSRQSKYEDFCAVHSDEYLDKLQCMAAGETLQERPQLSLECRGFEYAIPGYRYGLGGMLAAIDEMRAGRLERAYCFSLGGHHAYADWGHGYCMLNPMAAAARYAQKQGFSNVLIVDWDFHHGDGTQSIFAHDSSVYCVSSHNMLDLYMSTMRVLREGTTTRAGELGHCNIPIVGAAYDDEFVQKMELPGKFYRGSESLQVFHLALEHVPWKPDLIFIFSGFDAHRDDCGKNIMDWMNQDYETLTQYVLELAKKASCPVLSVHGGGYQLPITVSAAISHIDVLANYR
jgi:acetoin utilization deacetylase AcuC-like enzyme